MHTMPSILKLYMNVYVHSNPNNYSNHSVRMVLGMFDNFQLQCCVEATLLHCIQHISISLHSCTG